MKKLLFIVGLVTTTFFINKFNLQENILFNQEKPKKMQKENPSVIENKRMIVKGFKSNVEHDAVANTNFRKVLYTGKNLQLVVMSLNPGEEIGEETHMKNDQFFRFEGGNGKCIINGYEYLVKNGDAIIIPAGAKHNIINVDKTTELKMYTIYSPPQHKDGIVRATKKDAETMEAKFDGKTTE